MKQYLKVIAMLLVLLMIASAFAACGEKDNKDDPKETEKQTIVMVTHDPNIAKKADRVLIMENGYLTPLRTPLA